MPKLLGLVLTLLAAAAPALAQNEVELDRLATDQRQVAEQVRRLDRLLEVLEQRDRAEGREQEAELLASARRMLRGEDGQPVDLAGALESVALELSRKQTGTALETQAAAIELLQELLEALVRDQQRESERQRIADLQEWKKGLEELAARQERLREQAEELDAREKAEGGEVDEEARTELAEQQRELAEDIEAFNDEQARKGNASEDTERAEEEAQSAAERMQPPQSAEQQPTARSEQDMAAAREDQQDAQEALERQQQRVEDELERRESERKQQILIDVEREAEQLRQRHDALFQEYLELHEANEDERLDRAERSRLRRIAQDEQQIADEATELLLLIDEYGADSFPFFMAELREDHERLAAQIGPPRYRLDEAAVRVGEDLSSGWGDLVEALRTERERLRQDMPQQPPPGQQPQEEPPPPPLVQFTAELQLLKRMQEKLTGRLEALHTRLAAYERAGLEADPLDVSELLLLQERQAELALQFDSIVKRALGAAEDAATEDA